MDTELMRKIVFLAFAVLCVGIILFLIITILGAIRKKKFKKRYGIKRLPRSIKVKLKRTTNMNFYELEYPCWAISKKDGTADLRVKQNHIIWENCYLYVNNQIVVTDRPYDMIYLVKQLRQHNVEIGLCEEEKEKYTEIFKMKEAFVDSSDIQSIINYYAEQPTNFESLCAKLFERMGFIANLTPQTNDGGYDIILRKDDEISIVECKCYSGTHKVGRPAIQKLVGANSVVSADNMIFITTSDFSASAVSYATESNVTLINGKYLMELLRKHNFFEEKKVEVSISECQLEVEDLCAFVPIDIFESYF